MQLCCNLCGCMETDEEGFMVGAFFRQFNCCRLKLLFYSIITHSGVSTCWELKQGGTWLQGRLAHDVHLPALCCVKTGLEDTRPGRVSDRQHARWVLVGLAQTRRDLIARSLGTWRASSSTLLCQDRTWRHTSRDSITQTAFMVATNNTWRTLVM